MLFYAGVAFAYFVVFPLMFAFLTTTAPQGVQVMTDMANYLDFVLLLFFAFGIAFEMPVATVLLAATGLVKIETMTKNRGYVMLGIFVVAAFLTPPDAISQSLHGRADVPAVRSRHHHVAHAAAEESRGSATKNRAPAADGQRSDWPAARCIHAGAL